VSGNVWPEFVTVETVMRPMVSGMGVKGAERQYFSPNVHS
jgi:hypothetical protein